MSESASPPPPNDLHTPFVHDALLPHCSNDVHGAPAARTALHLWDVLSQNASATQPCDCVVQSPPIAMRSAHFRELKSQTAVFTHWNWKSVPHASPGPGIFSQASVFELHAMPFATSQRYPF